MRPITRLMVANRSEIATRVFRSAHELRIGTIAIYTHEDRYALHRFKADEAYLIGRPGEPIRAYLDIDSIVQLAVEHRVDAIHPGYGFLSENPKFAEACRAANVIFVGPSPEILTRLGDKTTARQIAQQAGVPILPGSDAAIPNLDAARSLARGIGYPVILKAAHGGGGRGMRVVADEQELETNFEQARRESKSAFGSDEVFIEKYIETASHIEVQLLGDQHGNLVQLYERDCSVQRRHQKVVEIAPAPSLDQQLRDELCAAAVAIGRQVGYHNAGTVEFLVDRQQGTFYFIEVNPRIQVEHTVTEEVTGVDIVKSQILIAQGCPLSDEEIGLASQSDVQLNGYALQCRVTTEDPANGFLPDYGRISHYRSASGMGVRLDAGSAFSGAVVHPYYDSLLVKVTARGRRFIDAVRRMERCLQEFRIRGVKSNLPFLIALMNNAQFAQGRCSTRFIDETPELVELPARRNRATRLLTYLAEVQVNGNPLVKGLPRSTRREQADPPVHDHSIPLTPGTRQRLLELGPERFSRWLLDQTELMWTDTTFRDAHQSLLATRFRTFDLLRVASAYAHNASQLFSLEMWGGATFDTSMRFLKESPWDRLIELRQRIPNILFQMLLRASNAVGYTNYPDNVVRLFVREAADAGIDVFRVFDALNWVPNMRVAMDAVLETGSICEAAICYTGDITDPSRSKYSLQYFVKLARQLEAMGGHILAIKDMAGLCKPAAARTLIAALKQELGIPVHFHTHDTSGIQAASILQGAEAGLDVADAAMAPMSGGTSQPNLNTLVEAVRFSPRASSLDGERLDEIANYWRAVREFYTPFDGQVLPATADLYKHEMPGGQYTNLYHQARALGLADQWARVCHVYAEVNQMLGDIVKVTPTSKAVGDMALFMVANDLSVDDVLSGNRELAFPASVIDLLSGRMGQPPGGFPANVQQRILRDQPPLTGRPGDAMPPADFDATRERLGRMMEQQEVTNRDVVSYLLYPKVFEEFVEHSKEYYDVSGLPTPVFFYGQLPGEEIAVNIEPGKTLIIKYLATGEAHADGRRTVFYEVNGVPRDVTVRDLAEEPSTLTAVKADPLDPRQIGASMPGMVVTVAVHVGDKVRKGQRLLSLEAMKMETAVHSEIDGHVAEVLVKPGSQVESGDLLVRLET